MCEISCDECISASAGGLIRERDVYNIVLWSSGRDQIQA